MFWRKAVLWVFDRPLVFVGLMLVSVTGIVASLGYLPSWLQVVGMTASLIFGWLAGAVHMFLALKEIP